MNHSLEETLKLFRDLKGVFNQIRTIEQGLNGMGNFLQVNDGLLEKQISYIESYAQKAEDISANLGRHFTQVDQKLNQIVDDNLRAIDQSAQSAYMKMDQYLAFSPTWRYQGFCRFPEPRSKRHSEGGCQYPAKKFRDK